MLCAAQYHGVWHCIVGRNFGSFVTNEAKHYRIVNQAGLFLTTTKHNISNRWPSNQ